MFVILMQMNSQMMMMMMMHLTMTVRMKSMLSVMKTSTSMNEKVLTI